LFYYTQSNLPVYFRALEIEPEAPERRSTRMDKKPVSSSNELKTKLTIPTSSLPTPLPEKERMDKETAQILVDDRVSTGG
jgi:hypothetical protein